MKYYTDLTEDERQLLAESIIAYQMLEDYEACSWGVEEIRNTFGIDLSPLNINIKKYDRWHTENKGINDILERMSKADFGDIKLNLQDYVLEMYEGMMPNEPSIEMTLGYDCIHHTPHYYDYDFIDEDAMKEAVEKGEMDEYGITPDGQALRDRAYEVLDEYHKTIGNYIDHPDFVNDVDPDEDIDVDDNIDP